MISKIDKELADKRKIRDGDLEDKISRFKGQWKALFCNPLTYAVIIAIVLYGAYCDWNYKKMIDNSFGYVITAVLTGLIQRIFIKPQEDKN
jgi:hypothetical protein